MLAICTVFHVFVLKIRQCVLRVKMKLISQDVHKYLANSMEMPLCSCNKNIQSDVNGLFMFPLESVARLYRCRSDIVVLLNLMQIEFLRDLVASVRTRY